MLGLCIRFGIPRFSVESSVIPAKAGINRTWVPACAGTTAFVTFRAVGGPQVHSHQTPYQYLLRTRLREAATRLATGRDRILDIALTSGFEDLSNFNHAFRAEFGVSPRVFRKPPTASKYRIGYGFFAPRTEA